jgi:hypothetical protein
MAIGVNNYLDTNKAFPFGGTKPWPIRGENKSWAFQILPYLEEANVYGLAKSKNVDDAAQKIAASGIPLYNCPTRRIVQQSVGQGNRVLMDYAGTTPGNFGNNNAVTFNEDHYWQGDIHSVPPKVTKHLGIFVRKTGATRNGDNENFTSLANKPCRVRQISDGLSKTMLISEKLLFANKYDVGSWHDDQGWADGWDPDVVRITSLPPIQDGPTEPTSDPQLRTVGFQFGSAHSLSMNAVMADSATIGINYEINLQTFNALGHRSDNITMPDINGL